MKGEYFMMKNHGLRRFFSLLLALFMVFTLLPTAALAEGTTGDDEIPSKTVVVDEGEKKTDPPAPEQPKDENPPAPEEPKTFTVTYTDGADGAAFANQVYSNLSSGTATPAFSGTPAREGYTFAGWKPAVAETVTADVTYAAQWDAVVSGTRALTLLPIPEPDITPAALNTGHKIDVTFTVLYVGDEFNIGYNYGSSEKTQFVCQYSQPHSDTAYNNHTIAISDIKAAADRASVNSGYQIVGWSKESNANPKTWGFNLSTPTACNKGTTIYLVAKNPNPTPPKPTAPDKDTVKNLLSGNVVTVDCINTDVDHPDKAYSLLDGSFTVGSVEGSNGNHTCIVTVHAQKYVDAHNNEFPGHTFSTTDTTPKPITLKHNGTMWAVQTAAPITFNVECDTTPTAPDKPTADWFIEKYRTVTVNCTNTPAGHGSESYDLVPESIEIGTPTYDSTRKIYSCVVTVTSTSYVAKFNEANGTHTPGTDTVPRNVYSNDGKNWVVPSSDDGSVLNPIVFNVACTHVEPPQAPAAPGHDNLTRLIGDIAVNCTNNAATHNPKSKGYALIADSYTTGNVEGTADTGYTFVVTVNAEKYVTQFDTDTNATHTPKDGSKVVTLQYVNDAWTVKEGKPVSFDVACVALPTFDELKEIFNQRIFVECTTKSAHTKTPYDLIADSYTIEDFSTMTDRPTCTVVLNSRKYVASYNNTTNAVHTPENEVKRVELILTDRGWVVAYDVFPVVFQVVCVPDAPTGRYLEDLLNQQVKVTCADPVHAPAVYELLAGSYRGSGVQPDGNGGYTYTVTIAAAEYVKKYNTERPKNHSLVKGEPAEKPVTLVWNADEHKWLFANADAVPVNFNVECLYTVTYEDGVNGSVFKPLSYTDLRKGDSTPTIEDPIRVGYEFAGWNPKVQKTVTGDATYTALWEEVDKTFTVKYNDNVKGKAFKEQVYEDLKYNQETPKFDGTPKRSGYTFTGWKPVVTDRVTKDVTYYAQWKSNSGKDKVPKTGDGQIVMILGSVLLFSFCGATAVCLNDRKRKQG